MTIELPAYPGRGIAVHRHHDGGLEDSSNQLDASLPNPAPGSLAGGPNEALQDPVAEQELQGCPPAMCYIDHIESYSTNEITINWNAPLVWLSSFAGDLAGGGAESGGNA